MTLERQLSCYMLYDNDIGLILLQCNVMAALAVAMTLRTVTNLDLLFRRKGQEQGWLCFALCTHDGESTFLTALSAHLTHLSDMERRRATTSPVDHREDDIRSES